MIQLGVDKVIPAGTSVKALLVSSVDATCAVYSSSDPIPVKLRLLDNGHLPKKVQVLLKGGIIIGSAYGNLSSERIYMRLERMTQVKPSGDFVSTSVAGYISGEDGKFGVRGTIVDKSENIVKNAAISGFLGGASQALQGLASKNAVDSWNTYNTSSDLIRQGGAKGVSNAFDMLADYYIRRAEQVQPVIQVNAGRIVDVTFTHEVPIGDLHVKERITKLRQNSREVE